MLYGLLTRLPEDAFATVDRRPQFGFGGYAEVINQTSDIPPSIAVMEWQTMAAYVGAAAESLEFGSHNEGSTTDFTNAEKLIRRFVAMLPEKAYFPVPENDVERGINSETIR
jgi:hypothetical protein